jgi:DNA-binding MarR family transcriptional regulator
MKTSHEAAARTLAHIRRIIHRIHAQSVAIETSVGITGPQFWALRELAAGRRSLSVGVLAERLALHKATAGRLADRLVRKRLATARRSERDRRVLEIRLTPRGRRLASRKAPRPAQADLLVELERLPAGKLARIEATLAELVRLLHAQDEEPDPLFEGRPRSRR